MRIAFLGFRGIPGTYGGFETLVEHIAPELAGRGHDVTVYCRKAFNTEGLTSYRGTRLITLPAPRSKYLETIVHTAACLPHILASRYDAVIVLNAINAFITLPIRLSPTKIALNVDGIERRRKKWNLLGKLAYMLSEYLATIIPHVTITDAETIQTYYLSRFGKSSTLLTYGGDLCRPDGTGMLEEIDVSPGQYFLYVARFEPENHPEAILRADRKSVV